MEALSNLDLFPPQGSQFRLTQGPVLHVPAQVVACAPDCALFAVSRGYGQTFTEAVLHSAHDLGLRPGGERIFTRWRDERIG
jgi:hypothetical protein